MNGEEYIRRDFVRSSACDGHCLLSPIAVLQLVEDQITEFFGEMGVDGITMRERYNAFWVYSKNRIELTRRPAWREPFTVRTRLGLRRAAKACADTTAFDENGGLLIASRVEMCLLDGNTGSIKRLDEIGMPAASGPDASMPVLAFDRFPKQPAQLIEQVKVRTSNLDMSNHTNNIEYLRFILNTLTPEALDSREMRGLELHYGAQSYVGQTLDIRSTPTEDGTLYTIERDGQNILHCKLW